MPKTGEMLNMFNFLGLTGAKTPENRGCNFKKCLKQGICSICSILSWHVPQKCLKQGKCSICSICWGNIPCSTPFPYFPSGLNILNILHISLVLSTFLEHAPKRLNILSISPVLSTF